MEERFDVFEKSLDKMLGSLQRDILEPAIEVGTPLNWLNNAVESCNHRLKIFQDWKIVPVVELYNNLKSLSEYQDAEFKRSMYMRGTLRLTEECFRKYGKKNDCEWNKLCQKRKQLRMRKVNTFVQTRYLLSKDGKFEIWNDKKIKRKPGTKSIRKERTISKKKA